MRLKAKPDQDKLDAFLASVRAYDGLSGELGDPGLVCYGCGHSAAREPFPGMPSGERPCCFCIRNPQREEWAKGHETERRPDADGFDFNPFAGNRYNGRPALKNPMDNYVTLDHIEEMEEWHKHPEYFKSVRVDPDGKVIVIEDEDGD